MIEKMNKVCFIAFLLFVFSAKMLAEIKLPSIIGSNMVLQQQSTVKLWGKASANKKVEIQCSWTNNTIKTNSGKEGEWLITVKTPVAGGPYSIMFSDGESKTINNIMIGEVWLCSGQSNMEMPMKGYSAQPVNDAQNTISLADASVPIRIINVEKNNSLVPLSDFNGKWQENKPENVRNISAAAYFYAKYLQSVLKVPVGIITSSWGGSSIEAWMDSVELSKTVKVNLSNEKNTSPVFQRHCQLYNAMLYPLHNYTIKGVLWYQAEANASQYKLYKKQFPAMIAQWRSLWGIGDFPFYYAQICPWKYKAVNSTSSARMREVQKQLSTVISNSGMIVTLDAGDSIGPHSPMKKEVGERFAYLALSKTYNYQGIEYQYPQYKSMTIVKDTAFIELQNAEEGIHSTTKEIKGFEIAGADRVFKPANVVITKKGTLLKISEPTIEHPVAVRYAFRNYMPISLFSNYGLPMEQFRTDDWEE
jgi:sialate O-acetylesterase